MRVLTGFTLLVSHSVSSFFLIKNFDVLSYDPGDRARYTDQPDILYNLPRPSI